MEAPGKHPYTQLKVDCQGRREENISGDHLHPALWRSMEIQASLVFQSTQSHLWLTDQKVSLWNHTTVTQVEPLSCHHKTSLLLNCWSHWLESFPTHLEDSVLKGRIFSFFFLKEQCRSSTLRPRKISSAQGYSKILSCSFQDLLQMLHCFLSQTLFKWVSPFKTPWKERENAKSWNKYWHLLTYGM